MHHMTRYEACQLVASRAILISQGATVNLTDDESRAEYDAVQIAKEELRLGRIDARIHRAYGGHVVELSVRDMKLPTTFFM